MINMHRAEKRFARLAGSTDNHLYPIHQHSDWTPILTSINSKAEIGHTYDSQPRQPYQDLDTLVLTRFHSPYSRAFLSFSLSEYHVLLAGEGRRENEVFALLDFF